jgi:hypothetical protein
MKRRLCFYVSLISIAWLIGVPDGLSAQNRRIRTIDDLFAAYEQERGVGYISISPSLLRLSKDKNSTEMDEVFNSIASLRILNLDISPESESLANRIRRDVAYLVQQERFEEVVKMREGEGNFVVYLSKNVNKGTRQIEALLMVASEKTELVLIGISGSITQKVIDAVLEGKIGITL